MLAEFLIRIHREPAEPRLDHAAHVAAYIHRRDKCDAVARRIPERSFVSLLADRGDAMDTMAFSRWVQMRREAAIDVCFVIGGAYGLELPQADHRLSLGPLTMPHQLARVVLLEQLYRAHRILAGEPYHH